MDCLHAINTYILYLFTDNYRKSMHKKELLDYLDDYLRLNEFTDSSKNWLQVETTQETIQRIWLAVDSTTYLIDKAATANIDLLITHHGNFRWYDQPLTWAMYQRMKRYLDADLWLYACHLPLDAHEEVGNNIWLLKAWCNLFGIQEYETEPFGVYEWQTIGFGLRSDVKVPVVWVITPFCDTMKLQRQLLNFGKHEHIRSVAFVSGGGWGTIEEAARKWYDLLVTGEAVHRQTTLAKELWQSILLWWHYETEKIGVKLLGKHLEKLFDVTTVFLDEKR